MSVLLNGASTRQSSLSVSGCSLNENQDFFIVLVDVTCQSPQGGLEHLTVSSDLRAAYRISLDFHSNRAECNRFQGFLETLHGVSSLAKRLGNPLAQGDETRDLLLSLLKQTQEHIPGMDG